MAHGASQVNNKAIRWASENGHTEIVRFLASLPNVDPGAEDNGAIRLAGQNGHTETIRFLTLLGGEVDHTNS